VKTLEPHVWLPRPRAWRRGLLRVFLGGLVWLWTLPTNLIGRLVALIVTEGPVERVTGPAAHAWLCRLRPGLGLDWIAAVTLGHVILYRRGMFDGRVGRLVLAHELAHTRQHDWLGPLYLPLHILAQLTSALLSLGARAHHSRVHDHNPLEQTFICLGASAYGPLARGATFPSTRGPVDGDAMLAAFGLL